MNEDIKKVLNLCQEALDSCRDNYGSYEFDSGGGFHQYFNEYKVETAKTAIQEFITKWVNDDE